MLHLKLEKKPLILKRSDAYIGVLIDDLVTKGTNEPYRMMTSRAEYRLLLRQDNADLRLTKIGYDIGLADEERYQRFISRENFINNEIKRIKNLQITSKSGVNEFLLSLNSTELKKPMSLYELIKRPEIDYFIVEPLDKERPELSYDVKREVNIISKYEGYIQKQIEEVNQFKKYENRLIPKDINYCKIKGLRTEAMQKLTKIKPFNVGQASRISGVSPADISVLLIYMERFYRQKSLYEEIK